MRSCLATLICLIASVSALAQDWERTIAQFQHTAWGAKEGAPDQIVALAQSEDGYLWIGTLDGLYRFDGVTLERYEPRSGGPLPTRFYSLWSNGRGELWIGAISTVSRLKDGTLRICRAQDGVPEGVVYGFAEDREGTIWVASLGGLARGQKDQSVLRWHPHHPGRIVRPPLENTAGRSLLVQGVVDTIFVIVADELSNKPAQVELVQHDYMIQ